MTLEIIMNDLIALAHKLLQHEANKYYFWCKKSDMKLGHKPIEAYETPKEIVILYTNEIIPESHNCDFMGCGQCHVKIRMQKNIEGDIKCNLPN